ncbi:sugar porter family MFS transporter [uncultured Parabacteroides sp.]|uniref:sugar porter family MFS transporter n=1 Tax=uncultured Parabacteroides sp. TaxID=512312 RepID=UPI00259B25B1|nr:sugar porter family MFS transporter [uncultured Parabacteroides sp.]
MNNEKENIAYLLFLSIVAALGGFLYGYDTAIISGTIQMVSEQFGLSSTGVGWYVSSALLGSILGVMMAGVFCDYSGRKNTLFVSAILFTASAVGCAFSGSFNALIIYRIIGGIGIGLVSVVSPLYISEISIAKYRGRFVSLYQLAITVGFLGAYLVNYGLSSMSLDTIFDNSSLFAWLFHDELWRGMLGTEVFPALIFIIIIFFIPESPRWLLLRYKENAAKSVLYRMLHDNTAVENEISSIKQVLSEKEKKVPLRDNLNTKTVKLILFGSLIAIMGQFMGVNAVLYYGPTIFQQNGLSGGESLLYQVLIGLVNSLTTVLGLLIIDKIGRKKLIYFGVTGMFISLIFIALFFSKGAEWGISPVLMLVFFLAYIFFCAISICLVVWVLFSEMFPIRIRGLAMSFSGMFIWLGAFLIGQLTPFMLENLGSSGTFLSFAVVCIPYLFIMRFCIPETTGRTLEEIEKELNK